MSYHIIHDSYDPIGVISNESEPTKKWIITSSLIEETFCFKKGCFGTKRADWQFLNILSDLFFEIK